jgi:putative effector of murein hydrolase
MPVVVMTSQQTNYSRVKIVYHISVLIAFFVLINFVVAGHVDADGRYKLHKRVLHELFHVVAFGVHWGE